MENIDTTNNKTNIFYRTVWEYYDIGFDEEGEDFTQIHRAGFNDHQTLEEAKQSARQGYSYFIGSEAEWKPVGCTEIEKHVDGLLTGVYLEMQEDWRWYPSNEQPQQHNQINEADAEMLAWMQSIGAEFDQMIEND